MSGPQPNRLRAALLQAASDFVMVIMKGCHRPQDALFPLGAYLGTFWFTTAETVEVETPGEPSESFMVYFSRFFNE